MKIIKIIGENGVQDKLCGRGNCPAAILEANGDVVIQGYNLNLADENQLVPPPGESFVRMKRATFEKIASQVLAA